MLNEIINNLKAFFRKQQFAPSFWGIFLNPFYFARKGLWENIRVLSQYIQGRILDIGCGSKPYKNLFSYTKYCGLEIYSSQKVGNKNVDVFYDGIQLPFNNNAFDSIIISQVFEHVFNPNELLNEVPRVLKPGGYLLMTVPFIWDEHEQPNDFGRYTSFGIKSLLQKHGFEIVLFKKSVNDIRVIFQMINVFLYKLIPSKNKYLNIICVVILTSPFNLIGEILAKITPKNDDLYLDNIILAQRL